jgi:Tol biopolymer transport system component
MVYFTSNREGHAEIYRLENGVSVQVTDTPAGQSWSPFVTQTDMVYFTSNREGHAEIYRLENGTSVRVTDTPAGAASWLGTPRPEVTWSGT